MKYGKYKTAHFPLFEADITGSRLENGYLVQNGKSHCLTKIPNLIRK